MLYDISKMKIHRKGPLTMAELKDSGQRITFNTGAEKETEGKGRHDLIPLGVLGAYYEMRGNSLIATTFFNLQKFVDTGNIAPLLAILNSFAEHHFGSDEKMFNELAKHYEDGAKKYFPRNWEKGIPLSILLGSTVRHIIKFGDEWLDEPHDRAIIWNICAMIHFKRNDSRKDSFYKLWDLPFNEIDDTESSNAININNTKREEDENENY